jgi:hypothetical protein
MPSRGGGSPPLRLPGAQPARAAAPRSKKASATASREAARAAGRFHRLEASPESAEAAQREARAQAEQLRAPEVRSAPAVPRVRPAPWHAAEPGVHPRPCHRATRPFRVAAPSRGPATHRARSVGSICRRSGCCSAITSSRRASGEIRPDRRIRSAPERPFSPRGPALRTSRAVAGPASAFVDTNWMCSAGIEMGLGCVSTGPFTSAPQIACGPSNRPTRVSCDCADGSPTPHLCLAVDCRSTFAPDDVCHAACKEHGGLVSSGCEDQSPDCQ